MKIKELELFILSFDDTCRFYHEIIGLEALLWTENQVSFKCGESVLIFNRTKDKFVYHFAFNIPPNVFSSAKNWLKQRVKLLTENGADEIKFTNLNARAIYFEDPAGNIVEFIARKEIVKDAGEPNFDTSHILEISEIGLAPNKIRPYANHLLEMGIPVRKDQDIDDMTTLTFFGEASDGVHLIIAPLGRRWIFSDVEALESPVIIQTDRGTVEYR